ncbi:MAG TPA: exodeoxyribonuclease V subunit gamma, partial [bacterium]|nr:exodeoxyribonuclease V subunit gamma [bacterium]
MSFSLHLGPYQPFLEEELAGALAAFRAAEPFTPLAVLVPNRALVRHLQEVLARRNGVLFNLRVLTLHQFLTEFTEEKWLREGMRLLPESLVPWALKGNARGKGEKPGPFRAVEGMPGFHKTLRATLSDLRQGGFTPDNLAAASRALAKDKARRRLSEKLGEFSRALQRHGDWKGAKGWKDLEDLYEDALTLPAPPSPVWTYGFYDASTLQQRVLEHLCSATTSHWFIPYEEHPAFEYAVPFVVWAKSLGQVEGAGKYEDGKAGPLGRLQKRLFIEGAAPASGDPEPAFEDSTVKVLLCPGEPREIREALRAVTQEAEKQKTHFSRCALLFRQLEGYRRMIAPAFEGQGLPLAKAPAVFLMETPEAKSLLLLLECFERDFPRETLMDFLACPDLSPEGFGLGEEDWDPHLWDQASKEAAVVEGKEAWLDRLQAYAKLRPAPEEGDDGIGGEASPLLAFRTKVLQALFDGARRFEKAGDWAQRAGTLFDLAEKWFLPSKAKEELTTLRRGVEVLAKDLPQVAGNDLGALLSDLMEEVKLPWDLSEAGGILVSDLMQARGVPFDVVVLPGLVEQGFPRVPRPDPLLLDEERRLLNGLASGQARVPEKAEGRAEEKLLFLLAARSAQKCLILTASHLHPVTGAPRIPSSYLPEALRAVTGERRVKWDEAESIVRKVPVSDWARHEAVRVDDLEEILGRFEEARQGNPLPAQAYADTKPFFEEARKLLKERQGSRKFTPYDGILSGPEALEKLRQGHSLKDKTLSASRLETYAACPLRYFYRYVLGLKVHPEPERVFQLDPAEKGNLMHSILEETLSRGVKEGWLKERDGEKALGVLDEETQKAFARLEKEGIPGSPALWEWSRFSVRRDLERELRKVLAEKDWTPVDFEKAFGREGQPEVSFTTPAGSFRLEGFMDRVDLSADG